jgi:hypothetical protein
MASSRSAARILLLLVALGGAARAEWQVLSSEPQANGPAGVVHVVSKVQDDATGARATLHFAILRTETAALVAVSVLQWEAGELG